MFIMWNVRFCNVIFIWINFDLRIFVIFWGFCKSWNFIIFFVFYCFKIFFWFVVRKNFNVFFFGCIFYGIRIFIVFIGSVVLNYFRFLFVVFFVIDFKFFWWVFVFIRFIFYSGFCIIMLVFIICLFSDNWFIISRFWIYFFIIVFFMFIV